MAEKPPEDPKGGPELERPLPRKKGYPDSSENDPVPEEGAPEPARKSAAEGIETAGQVAGTIPAIERFRSTFERVRLYLHELSKRGRERSERDRNDPARRREGAVIGAWSAAIVGILAALIGWSHNLKTISGELEGEQIVMAAFTSMTDTPYLEESNILRRMRADLWAVDRIDPVKAKNIQSVVAEDGFDLVLGTGAEFRNALFFRRSAKLVLQRVREYDSYREKGASALQSAAPLPEQGRPLVAHFETGAGFQFLFVHWPGAPAPEAMSQWRPWINEQFPKLKTPSALPLFLLSTDALELFQVDLTRSGPLQLANVPKEELETNSEPYKITEGQEYSVRVMAAGLVPGLKPKLPKIGPVKSPSRAARPVDISSQLSNNNLSMSELKQLLKSAGHFTGTIDDSDGPEVRAAIKEFQAAAGMPADGMLGVQTFRSLVKAFQVSAGQPADGMLGSQTRKVLRDEIRGASAPKN